ncbi:MAG: GTPase Era [Acidimicrobiia bacterium]
MTAAPREHASGFTTLVGRPNVGKSTLVNALVGAKVAIVSARPQTTRTTVRGVLTTDHSQVVFVDTPGIHKPRTLLGERTNERALSTLREVDVVCLVIDATASIGPGDRYVAGLVHQASTPRLLVVTKTDRAKPGPIAAQLATAAAELGDFDAFVPVSGKTGDGVNILRRELDARMPEGPRYYPGGVVTDQPETTLAAELLREKLLATARDELPHSIAVTVEEGEDARDDGAWRLRAVVRVERDSQKGIVIGRGGLALRDAGTAARQELEALLGAPVHLTTRVVVDRDWQRRAPALDRLGL